MSLLDAISQPSELQSLSLFELEQVAAEIRQRILKVLSQTGGHLTSNLGIVELTIALHYVFDSPKDKLIFDVSHQTYPHKLLTGRNERFEKIRQYQGLCGFSHPRESPHDHFFAGHAGTALSLALGAALRRDPLQKEPEYILPILGDASLTCGLTLEALNNIPKDLPHFIGVLNDNARSISKSVGNIKNILSRLLSRSTSSLKSFSSSTSFFEEFGFSYVGPIDGHNIEQLIHTFQSLKNNPRPVLVHVITVKGKGLPIAIKNPTPYHGAQPFDLESGKFHPSPSRLPTFPKIFGKFLLELADKDPSIMAITPAMPAGSCLEEFLQQYPDRCFDVGIAEGHCVTFAGGLAYKREKKVVVAIYATFLQRAFDNLFQDICMQEAPVIFALDRAFISGPDGSTHHGIYDIAFLYAMPHLVIAQARNGHVLKELLKSAFSWERPTAIRYPNLETEEPDLPLHTRSVGKGEILIEGETILLIALGHMDQIAFEVRQILLEFGIFATIVDPVFLKPLDEALLHQLLKTHSLVATIEEHSVLSGLGSIFNSFVIQNRWKGVEVINFGIPDIFVQFGKREELLHEIGLDSQSIAKQILAALPQISSQRDLDPEPHPC